MQMIIRFIKLGNSRQLGNFCFSAKGYSTILLCSIRMTNKNLYIFDVDFQT